MSWVYILKSKNYQKTYTGSTVNLPLRIEEHNSGKSLFSRRYKPWVLVYSEEYLNLSDARKRERYFKSAAGRRFIVKNNIIPR